MRVGPFVLKFGDDYGHLAPQQMSSAYKINLVCTVELRQTNNPLLSRHFESTIPSIQFILVEPTIAGTTLTIHDVISSFDLGAVQVSSRPRKGVGFA